MLLLPLVQVQEQRICGRAQRRGQRMPSRGEHSESGRSGELEQPVTHATSIFVRSHDTHRELRGVRPRICNGLQMAVAISGAIGRLTSSGQARSVGLVVQPLCAAPGAGSSSEPFPYTLSGSASRSAASSKMSV